MSDDEAERRQRLDEIDAELCRLNPSWKPLDERTKAMITAVVVNAAPISDAQARRIARLLRGRSDYRNQ